MNRKILFYCLSALLLLTACGKGHNDESSTASNKVISSGSDLDGHSVGFITGSVQDFYVAEHASGATPVSMASTSEVLAATAKGLCDYSLSDETTIMCVDLKESHLKVVGNINDISFPLAAGFRKDDPAMKEVKQSLDDFILQQKENHVLDSMAKRWATPRLDTVSMPKVQLPTSGKTLVIGSMNDNAPFGFIRNDEFAGFEAELIYRWAAETGHRVRIEYYPFSSLIAALQTNKIDIIISSVSVTEERQQHIDFSEPYYFCHTIVLQGDQAATSSKGFWQWVKTGVQDNLIAEGRWKMILDGLWETVIIAFWALLIGTLLGCGICGMRMSRNKFCNGFAKAYIGLMRGVPILVFLMILFYVVFAKTGLSARWVAILAFSINFSAYVSEMFRNGIESVDKGQREAGWALGLSHAKTFILIVVPQALRRIIPVYKGEAVSLIKNTSIVGYIAIQDLTKVSDIIRSRTFDAFFPLIVITIIYLILAWLLGFLIDRIKIR